MKRLPILSSDEVIKVLKKAGFSYATKRGKGSHVALYRQDESGHKRLVIVPKRKELPRGTLAAIIEQSGLSREEFLNLLG